MLLPLSPSDVPDAELAAPDGVDIQVGPSLLNSFNICISISFRILPLSSTCASLNRASRKDVNLAQATF